jgi:hypothetical protein
MKKKYLLILLSAIVYYTGYGQMPTGYDTTSSATLTGDEEIHEVKIGSFTNTSGCAGASPALWPSANGLPASKINKYSNYTGGVSPLPLIYLSPGSTSTYSLKLGYEASNIFGWGYGWSIFIDYNRNGVFDLPGERVANSTSTITSTLGCNFTTVSGSFTVPSSLTGGESLLRVVQTEFTAIPTPTGSYLWGETEDYKVTFCAPLTRTKVKTDPNCTVDTSGKAKIIAVGGTPPLKYSWNSGPYTPLDSLKNIAAGTYYLITKDSSGCLYYDTFILAASGTLLTSKSYTNSCAQFNSGAITLTGLTGTAPYTYSFNLGTYSSINNWTNLSKGQYIIQTKDVNNCTRKDTVILDTFTRYNFSSKTVDSILCKNDGAINYQFTDSTQYRSFSINGGAVVIGNNGLKTYPNLSPGNYIVKLIDKNQCYIFDTTAFIASNHQLLLKSKLNFGCNGVSKGKIVVETIGKKPGYIYLYNWSHISIPLYTNIDSFSNLNDSTYKLVF